MAMEAESFSISLVSKNERKVISDQFTDFSGVTLELLIKT